MLEIKKILIIFPPLLACLLTSALPALSEQRYVVDTIVVSLREGPGPQYKPIKTVQTGQAMELIESKNNFIRVRTADGDVGWLPSQYATSQPTSADLVKELQGKINALSAQNEQLSAQITGKEPPVESGENQFSGLKKLQEKLDQMTEQYNLLEADAKDIIQIRDENIRLRSEVATLKTSLKQLQDSKKYDAISKNIYWFLAGGAVFLIGFITGKISFRRQRHSLTL